MDKKLSTNEIIELYSKSVDFGFSYKVIGIITCFIVSLIMLYGIFNFSKPDNNYNTYKNIAIIPMAYLVVIGLIKHCLTIFNDKRLRIILWNPI